MHVVSTPCSTEDFAAYTQRVTSDKMAAMSMKVYVHANDFMFRIQTRGTSMSMTIGIQYHLLITKPSEQSLGLPLTDSAH